MTARTLAVVGAGLAGAKAAEAARDAGYEGRVVLIGDEGSPPYERPPLSKAVLRGEDAPSSAHVHPDGFYVGADIEIIHEDVTEIDVAGRRVSLRGGDQIAFDSAVLATGASPRRLTAPGADLEGVHYLRTLEDALALQDAIKSSGRVAVVGAGWIGSEVAASARQMGAEVVLIDPAPVPLHRVVGDVIGDVFGRLHADNGVRLRLGVGVHALRGSSRVSEVVLDDGTTEAADVVVVGIGVTPRTEVAERAGLRVDNGVIVNHYLETTAGGIYAVGDVANAWHPRYRRHVRVEHWANALNQGVAAGQNIARPRQAYDRLPYFFSDQYDLGMEYVGLGSPADRLVVRGDLDAREFVAFWHRGGVVTAAMHVNVWGVVDDLKAIVSANRPVEIARLADERVALSEAA